MSVSLILYINLLNLSSSWNNTILVGVISLQSALKIPISHNVSGSLPKTSFAVAYIPYYLLPAPPALAEENCMSSKFYQLSLAELVKYVI
jgi:hypothetical protein